MKAVLIIAAVIIVLYLCFVKFFGNWRLTMSNVITMFVSVSRQYENASINELLLYTLDARYPLVTSGYQNTLYLRRQAVDRAVISWSLSYDDSQSSLGKLLLKDTLPALVLRCLLIEQNSITKKRIYNRNPQLLYDLIEKEIIEKGFSKYC